MQFQQPAVETHNFLAVNTFGFVSETGCLRMQTSQPGCVARGPQDPAPLPAQKASFQRELQLDSRAR
jgi:hypothetical protein